MRKVLMLSSVASMIEQFNIPNILLLQELGAEVHVLANFSDAGTIPKQQAVKLKDRLKMMNITVFDVDISRSPLAKANVISYKKIKKILSREQYDLIHCHSPIGGVLTRLAARPLRKLGTKVIYTAHGFHFFKGSQLTSWLIFYPIERFFARWTDVLITINKEDFERAKKFKAKKVEYIPGVGLNIKKFSSVNINVSKIKELNIPDNSFIILSTGELNENKNHSVIVKAIAQLNRDDIHYLICGIGKNKSKIEKLANKLGISNQVHLLGYRNDINELCCIADIFAFPSKREGLGIAGLEAMASGLPLVTSNVQGIMDYSIDGITGYNYESDDVDGFSCGIKKLVENQYLSKKIGLNNKKNVKEFDIENINRIMARIYKSSFNK